METSRTCHIISPSELDYHQQVFRFARESHKHLGQGAVMVYQELYHQNEDGSIIAKVTYVPHEQMGDRLPLHVANGMPDYDSSIEVVLCTLDQDMKVEITTLRAQEIGLGTKKSRRAGGNVQVYVCRTFRSNAERFVDSSWRNSRKFARVSVRKCL